MIVCETSLVEIILVTAAMSITWFLRRPPQQLKNNGMCGM